MKKTLFASILLFSSVASCAQTINYGLKGGINFSELSIKSILFQSQKTDYVTGFNIGGVADLGFQKFSIQPALFFTTKGGKISAREVYPNGQYLATINPVFKSNYLELPVNFLYRFRISPALSLHAGGGPYLAYEFSATGNDGTAPGPAPTRNVAIGYDNPDYGLNFQTGLKLNNKFLFDADYGLGLADLSAQTSIKNRTFSLSVGCIIK